MTYHARLEARGVSNVPKDHALTYGTADDLAILRGLFSLRCATLALQFLISSAAPCRSFGECYAPKNMDQCAEVGAVG